VKLVRTAQPQEKDRLSPGLDLFLASFSVTSAVRAGSISSSMPEQIGPDTNLTGWTARLITPYSAIIGNRFKKEVKRLGSAAGRGAAIPRAAEAKNHAMPRTYPEDATDACNLSPNFGAPHVITDWPSCSAKHVERECLFPRLLQRPANEQ